MSAQQELIQLNQGWQMLENSIAKVQNIFEGTQSPSFGPDELMTCYT